MTTYRREFEIDDLAPRLESLGDLEWGASRKASEGNEWDDGATYADACRLMRQGWDVPVPKLDVGPRSDIRVAMRYAPERGWTGSEVDMGAWLQGRPDCMVEVVQQELPSPVVRIGVERVAAADVKAEQIIKLGRQVLVLVESLRLAGIPAEVWACCGVHDHEGSYYDLRVKVQDSARPLDVSRIAFWVAHPAALRRIMFAIFEEEPKAIRDQFGFWIGGYWPDDTRRKGGYGYPKAGLARGDFDEWTPSVHSSESDLKQWVRGILSRNGALL